MNKDLNFHSKVLCNKKKKASNTLIKIVRIKAIKSDVKDIYNITTKYFKITVVLLNFLFIKES